LSTTTLAGWWAAAGRDRKPVAKFLDLLGEERCKQIQLVSCDDADYITLPISERCPNAAIRLDPWHIVKAATDALDEIRREVWNQARRSGNKQLAKDLKDARFALWKKPEKLTDRQQAKLAWFVTLNVPIYRAYLLKEQLRAVYSVDGVDDALELLDRWPKWVRRCRLEPFVKLARRITQQRALEGRGVAAARPVVRTSGASEHSATAHPRSVRVSLIRSADRRSRCSHSAASAHHYQAGETNPQMRQQMPFSLAISRSTGCSDDYDRLSIDRWLTTTRDRTRTVVERGGLTLDSYVEFQRPSLRPCPSPRCRAPALRTRQMLAPIDAAVVRMPFVPLQRDARR
jgi:hypothetical protein